MLYIYINFHRRELNKEEINDNNNNDNNSHGEH